MGVAVQRAPGVRDPLKSSVTGPCLLVDCYLQIKFHKKIRVNPPPLTTGFFADCIYLLIVLNVVTVNSTQFLVLVKTDSD